MTRSAFKYFVLQDTPWTFSPTSTSSDFKHLERSRKLTQSINQYKNHVTRDFFRLPLYRPLNWIKSIPCKAEIVRLLRDSLTPTLPSCCPGELIMADGRDFKVSPKLLRLAFMVLSIFAPLPLVVQDNSDQGGQIPQIACFLLLCFYPFFWLPRVCQFRIVNNDIVELRLLNILLTLF